MNVWSYVDIYSDVYILELCVDEGTDASAADPRRERARRYGDTVPDLERRLFVVQGPKLRPLQNFGIAVRHEQRELSARNGDGKTAADQGTERNYRRAASRSAGRSLCHRRYGCGRWHDGAPRV